MTACSNRKGRAGRVITAALVGALSVGAPAVALATGGVDLLATDAENWDANKIVYTVDADVNGKYSVDEGDTFAVESITDVFGETISPSDYTVVYLYKNGGVWNPTNLVNQATLDGRNGGMPGTAGSYAVAIIDGDWSVPTSASNWDITALLSGRTYSIQEFSVKSVGAKTLAGAYAYEGTDKDDTSFQYNGASLTVSFASKNKTALVGGTDYTVKWTALPVGVAVPGTGASYSFTNAGTYTAELTGINNYAGSSATVTFTVSPIDLKNDTITIAPSDTTFSASITNSDIMVNGKALDNAAAVTTRIVEVNDGEGAVGDKGKYLIRITPSNAGSNVTGSYVDVVTYCVDNVVSYTYDGAPLTSGNSIGTFDPTLNNGFDPSKISASANRAKVGYTYKVLDADGNETSSWSEPGEYSLVLETPYGGSTGSTYYGTLQCKFTVSNPSATDFSNAKVYMSVDGKNVANRDHVTYTGEAISPVYVVKDGRDTLVEGEDYTVTVTKGDDEVSEIKDPGTYTFTFKMNDSNETEKQYEIIVDKATIVSAEATAEYFAIPADGSAVTPTFYGYTEANQKGDKFELASDEISVKYYEYDEDATDKKGDAVKAEDLNEDGVYVADFNVLSTSKTFSGSNLTVAFRLSKTAVYTDVDANAWYGKVVYDAKDLNYMTGITGTSLFMPTATISRAEVASVMFKMAGGQDDHMSHPTRFTDVPEDSWFAQAADWASRSGVMGGYTGTDSFGSYDATTREQVAAILYKYAKAQGKDVSVKDADAALAKFDDASEVSAWAKTAVAWAIENGVLGNGGYIGAKDTITRAEMAAMAVNFQPEKLDEPWA